MQPNEVLLIDIRSSIGINQDLMIANTLGVIDSDYYNNPKNEGNIGFTLRNLKPAMKLDGFKEMEALNPEADAFEIFQIPIIKDLTEENTVHIKKGERVAQAIFVEFKESDNCNSDTERTGGTGSTGTK
jgi:dUTP pyrophosphatase